MTDTAEELLRWAVKHAGKVTFATGFGAEGCVLIDMISRAQLAGAIDVFTLDTGVLFPETYELWRTLESRYGITIRAVTPALTIPAQALRRGPKLWERDPDACCDERKVQPLRAALAGFDTWITAIRRDQTPERAAAAPIEHDAKFGLRKINPLVAWSERDVWDYIHDNDVPYNELYARGYRSIGCAPCTSAVARDEDARAGRWRGHTKRECGLHGVGAQR
jgi:phosphoadenylyl-sulfate reductase (thioredoxin)